VHPILFEIGSIKIYTYGFMIAVGVVAGVAYMAMRGKREVGLTFDQANNLFLLIFLAAFVGGKVFLFFENPSRYWSAPRDLLTGSGFVFYGSFLFAVPTMLWYFKKQKLPALQMLDIMAITTCLVHMFGRVGCFFAGCCYGKITESFIGVVFTDPVCQANPLNTPLIPTQLLEAGYIFVIMVGLLFIRERKQFNGQLFLLYLMLYATGRFVLEYWRGDISRGFVIENILSNSQFIALCILAGVFVVYRIWSRKNTITP
jgi:phosphatidylglycerol---prolipoprotein diacylglyceryl transferase